MHFVICVLCAMVLFTMKQHLVVNCCKVGDMIVIHSG